MLLFINVLPYIDLIQIKIVPLFKVRELAAAVHHYTVILDFELEYPLNTDHFPGADLINGDARLQLTTIENDRPIGSVCNVAVNNVDALFAKYKSRGLDVSGKEDSPVHQAPLDQSWGTREFYVTDADGNTLRFCQNIY